MLALFWGWVMERFLRVTSLVFLFLAIPGLVVTDWYAPGIGVLVLFVFGTLGLVLDQARRTFYPSASVASTKDFYVHQALMTSALVLLIMSPMAVVYWGGLRLVSPGLWIAFMMVTVGLTCDRLARNVFPRQRATV